MKIKNLLEISQKIYDSEDEDTLIFLESLFRVVFSGEFDKAWLEENIKSGFEKSATLETYYEFMNYFEFEFDEYDNIIINDSLIDEMLNLAVLLSIYVEFEFNFYYFINQNRDFISLIINNGVICFSGLKIHTEHNIISNEIDKLLEFKYENFEIESIEQIVDIKYNIKSILENESILEDKIIESWKIIEKYILVKSLDLLINKYTYVVNPLTKELIIPTIVKYVPLYNNDTKIIEIVRVKLIQNNGKFQWNFDKVQKDIKFFFNRN